MYPEKLDSFQLHKRVDILLQDYSPRKLSHGCQFQFSPLAIAGPRLFSKLRQEEVTVCNEAGGAWIDDTRGRHEINAWGKSKINLRLGKRKKKNPDIQTGLLGAGLCLGLCLLPVQRGHCLDLLPGWDTMGLVIESIT